jgi:dsDNA-specific endonuclease/ATPase MutS2
MEEPEPITLPIGDVLDLHAFSPRDIPTAVEAYLDEAYSRGFNPVRIIHGRGIGVQRERVRAMLLRTPFVSHLADAPPESGGWGATVVHFVKR